MKTWTIRLAVFIGACWLAPAVQAQGGMQLRLRASEPQAVVAQVAPALTLGLDQIVPRTASDQRLAGWILVGAGVLHLVLLPVCYSDLPSHGAHSICVGSSIVLGISGIALGAWFLSRGYHTHVRRRAAAREHGLALQLSRVHFAAHGGAGMLQYRTEW